MARPVRPEVRYADLEARRYFNATWSEAERLNFKKSAAGFDLIIKSTGGTPTEDDETLDRVGEFVMQLPVKNLRVVQKHYRDNRKVKVKAYELDMTEHQFKYIRGMFLTGLAAYLLRK